MKYRKGESGNPDKKFKSGAEAQEAGRKGGIRSQEVQHEKARLTEALRILLEREYTNKKGETFTGFEIAAIGQFKQIQNGDTRAFKLAAELLGEYRKNIDLTSGGQPVNVQVPDQETADILQQVLNSEND